MGAGLIVKPALNRYFSVMTFGIAQIAMDIEPGIGMLRGAEVLHGATHTILGALVIASLVMLVAPFVCVRLIAKWNKEVVHYGLPYLAHSGGVQRTAVIVGAYFGTLSHVALDSLIHHDIRPLLPFSQANPLLGLIDHDVVYRMCAIAGVLGALAWLTIRCASRFRRILGGAAAPHSLVIETPKNAWVLWVNELRLTWIFVGIFAVLPGVLFGTGIFAIILLALSLLIGGPSVGIACWRDKRTVAYAVRRLVVLVLVPVMALAYVLKVDQGIPENATALTDAIEAFRVENGRYPESLEMLAPKHLKKIPRVRFSVFQPRVVYRLGNGKPVLAIPSAAGDAFAQYEYDFDARVWRHRS